MKKAVKTAEELFHADLWSRKKQIQAIEKAAFRRRLAFVKELEPETVKSFLNHIALFLAKWYDTVSEKPDINLLEGMLDLRDFCEKGIVTNRYVNNPGYAILCCIVSTYVKDAYHWHYRDQFKYTSAEELCQGPIYHDDLYELLTLMGYVQTEEERMWRDGTHPAYIQKTVKDFEGVEGE